MAEYIERGALIKYIEEDLALCDNALSENAPITYGCKLGLRAALGYAQAIAAADVVEVVRCKGCIFFRDDTEYCRKRKAGYCEFDDTIKDKNHYCGYGEAEMDGKGEGE